MHSNATYSTPTSLNIEILLPIDSFQCSSPSSIERVTTRLIPACTIDNVQWIQGLNDEYIVAPTGERGFSFGSSVIMIVLSKAILGVTPLSADFNIQLHPIALAGWVGLFVTAINLFPIGQLDGGHVFYSLLGKKSQIWAKCFFTFLLFLVYFWPSWGVWAILLLVLTRFKSAPLKDEDVLPLKVHKRAGYAAITIFFLTFVPVPIELI